MPRRSHVQIIGASGQLWLLVPNPNKPGEAVTLLIDFNNPERMQYIRQNLKQYLPTKGYHFNCDRCHITNAAREPQQTVTCIFCGYTCHNENYQAWQKLKELMAE